ncbi:hypothetical protein M407DRAFT_220118 [Tulasnella calospora MUT 4182]|uniref:BTB domain-containing protein n=1 Tax=Tulasnella calospora MUT 4182 TaxID=1051891 RepID=A0A0C3Q9I2_9AGAM|nr:hypothetical protein M407DRAFT_220118 [Tulasnella calospora MUT 4182]
MASESVSLEPVPSAFSSNSPADCILRSSDGLDFYVLRGILIFASDVFKDMFSLPPTGPNAEKERLPIINMTENGRTLSALLSVIYPIVPPEITSISLAADLAQAWQKYLMPLERLRPFLSGVFNESSLTERPLDAYALAWRLGDKAEAKKASQWTHGASLSFGAMSRIVAISGDQEAVNALTSLRDLRQPILRRMARVIPIREHACPNHGGGDNGLYDRKAYADHMVGMEEQVHERVLNRPGRGACHDFRSFLGLQFPERWPGPKLPKRCSHPTDNFCFGNMNQWQVSEVSETIETLREPLPVEVEW